MIEWARNPRNRVKAAWVMLWGSIAGAASTHTAILFTKPPGFTSWTAHLLLALSWGAITITALNIIVTTDIRDKQEESTES